MRAGSGTLICGLTTAAATASIPRPSPNIFIAIRNKNGLDAHPPRLGGIGVLVTALLLSPIGGAAWDGHRSATRERDLNHLQSAASALALFDETLTRAVRMAALSGEGDWLARYEQFERQMRAVIGHTRELAPQAGAEEIAQMLERVDTERAALARARQGRRGEALQMIDSAEYDA